MKKFKFSEDFFYTAVTTDDNFINYTFEYMNRKFLYKVDKINQTVFLYEYHKECGRPIYIWNWSCDQMEHLDFEKPFKLFIKINNFLRNIANSKLVEKIQNIETKILSELRGLTKEEFELLKEIEHEQI